MAKLKKILALDIGDARIGVAVANTVARIPSPLAILDNDPEVYSHIKDLTSGHDISLIVVGMPRNMSGEETDQSKTTRQFVETLRSHINTEIVFADESLSSKRAEESGQKSPNSPKYLDDIAACFILEEYFASSNE